MFRQIILASLGCEDRAIEDDTAETCAGCQEGPRSLSRLRQHLVQTQTFFLHRPRATPTPERQTVCSRIKRARNEIPIFPFYFSWPHLVPGEQPMYNVHPPGAWRTGASYWAPSETDRFLECQTPIRKTPPQFDTEIHASILIFCARAFSSFFACQLVLFVEDLHTSPSSLQHPCLR